MSLSACPTDVIHAPLERVWRLLLDPAGYASWWGAETRSIAPPGPARPGQQIHAQARALARKWQVDFVVESVDQVRHQLQLTGRFPLGITIHNTITCVESGPGACRASFG
jgi:hypothetical protein